MFSAASLYDQFELETNVPFSDGLGLCTLPVFGAVDSDPVFGAVDSDPVFGAVGSDPVFGAVGSDPVFGAMSSDAALHVELSRVETPLPSVEIAASVVKTPTRVATASKIGKRRRTQRVGAVKKRVRVYSPKKHCACKNSKCLKLYCICFAKGVACGVGCTCSDCGNIEASDDKRKHAPCTCGRNACLKGYCVCHRRGMKCGDACTCTGCNNR